MDVSEALRNLAMGHATSTPFRQHYLGREIGVDLWGILRGQSPQQALLKQSGSIGHSISRRRPTDLTPGQSASVLTHPTIVALKKAAQRHPRGSEPYIAAQRAIRNEKQKLRRELKHDVRDKWTDNQATDDVERQLGGHGFAEFEKDSDCRPQTSSQKCLLAALTAPLVTTLEGQFRRRNDAINAISNYCLVKEGGTPRQSRPRAAIDTTSSIDPPEDSPVYNAIISTFVNDTKERPRRCFVCIGEALNLPPEDAHDLIGEFYSSTELTRHFKNKHLSKIKGDDKVECKVCQLELNNRMHFQSHAMKTHGTVS